MLDVGQTAPDLLLPDQHGRERRLSELWAKGPVVLYFYPKDETAGCTAEACAFRDAYQSFSDAGAEVVGVSKDGVAEHASFASHHRLPFVLLSDAKGVARQRYEVKRTLGIIEGRVTYVIDREGIVRHVTNVQLSAARHIAEPLEVLKRIL